MTDHRVDDLQLRVRASPHALDDPSGATRSFVSQVLAAVGDRLESRGPGHLIFLRNLQLQWRVGAQELSDASAISRYADQIADNLHSLKPQTPGLPLSNEEVIVFRDEATQWACYLFALAAGNGDASSWVYGGLAGNGVPLISLASRGPEFVLAVLIALANAGVLIQVVEQADATAIAKLNEAIGIRKSELAVSVAQSRVAQHEERLAEGQLSPNLPWPSRLLIHYVESARLTGTAGAADSIAALAYAAASMSSNASTRGEADAQGGRGDTGLHALDQAIKDAAESPLHNLDVATDFGGLFYLLSLARELEIGEILWKACLPEGTVLAHAAALICGPAATNDPAPLLFGGGSRLETLDVSEQQQQEAAIAIISSIAAALPRRGLASLPQLSLRLTTLWKAYALVASESGSPFPLFVWPGAVDEALRKLLATWPASAPRMLGDPGIAELEGRIRIKPARTAGSSNWLIRQGDSPAACALVSQVAGALCYLFVARAQTNLPHSASTHVERYFSLPANIALHPDEMIVKLPMDRVEIALRKSGLDRDPGWVPWLHRKVRFEWVDQTNNDALS